MSALVQIEDLHVSIASKALVKGISFSVEAGESVSIVGESGSGKTVTTLAILGLQPGEIRQGKIQLKGQDLLQLGAKKWHALRGKEIAYVFQEPGLSLSPSMRCGTQLGEVIQFHTKCSKEEAKQQSLSWFRQVGFEDPERIYTSYPHQISGGQKQRVMLCLAMAPKPSLLIADEPSTALDNESQKRVMELIKKLCRENSTALLFITHDLLLASEMSTRMLVMQNGTLVESGSPADLLKNPQETYTKKLVQSRLNAESKPATKSLPSKEIVLEANAISIRYKSTSVFGKSSETRVLDDLSFCLHKGETIGLVGSSGSGKTSLAKVLMGLLPPSKGEVRLFGENLYTLSPDSLRALRKRFRIVFQDPYASFNPKLRIGCQIEETMAAYSLFGSKKERRKKTEEWLEKVGLEAADYDCLPQSFSGGQRQRIAIARALACEPEFLICDECVSSLDMSLQRDILQLIISLQKEYNMGILFISHDPHVVHYMCDKVIEL